MLIRFAGMSSLDESGFALVPSVLAPAVCGSISDELDAATFEASNLRSFLDRPWCQSVVERLSAHPRLVGALAPTLVAMQCTLFDKRSGRNWLVGMHQDLAVPVGARVDHPDLTGWSVKEGRHFVNAPVELLEQLLAVRIHIDECAEANGALRIVPGSHRLGRLTRESAPGVRFANGEVVCAASVGDALLMRPLALHSSSKATSPSRRRVLHFLFAPPEPGYGLSWQRAA
jgi:ectoine hydroxylase-related dioxygenase (phytanoyl-CoA dioxygenase family)